MQKEKICCDYCNCRVLNIKSHLKTEKHEFNFTYGEKEDLFGKTCYYGDYRCRVCKFTTKKEEEFRDHLCSCDHFKEFLVTHEGRDFYEKGEVDETIDRLMIAVDVASKVPRTIDGVKNAKWHVPLKFNTTPKKLISDVFFKMFNENRDEFVKSIILDT